MFVLNSVAPPLIVRIGITRMWNIKPELKKLNYKNPLHLLAVGFGSGLSPVASGTAGSAAAIPLCYLFTGMSIPFYLLLILVATGIGVIACQSATDAIGVDDHGAIVWDEFVGMFITTIGVPTSWVWMVVCFFVFRIFDIFKPWPIYLIDENMRGGWGIILDDVLAGVFSLITVHFLMSYLPL